MLGRLTLALAYSFVLGSAALSEERLIDGSTLEAYEISIREMAESLPPEHQKTFARGLLNMVFTEYPPAKGLEGLGLLVQAEAAMRAAHHTMNGRSLAEVLARGITLSGNDASATDVNANAYDDVRGCLRNAVNLSEASIEAGEYSQTLRFKVTNRLPWAIAGLRVHYEIYSEGRAVPWEAEDSAVSISGGVEPGETRDVGFELFGPATTEENRSVRINLLDVVDQDERLAIGDVKVLGWSDARSDRPCNPAEFLSAGASAADAEELASAITPLTREERDEMRRSVQRCWTVPAGIRDLGGTVVVSAELSKSGEVLSGSISLIEPSIAPNGRVAQLFEASRRALIRCSPYQLPAEKFALWKNIEMVFDRDGANSW